MNNNLFKNLGEERNELVVMSNEFVMKTRINFTRSEVLTLGYILKKIDPNQENFSVISFSINDFLRVVGLDTSGRQYQDTKDTLISIKNKGFWMKVEGQTREVGISFFDQIEVDTETKIFTVQMNKELMPFFLQLKERIEYPYYVDIGFTNKYSSTLMKHFLAHEKEKLFTIDIKSLKTILSIPEDAYEDFFEFRRRILNKVIDEINEKTRLTIEMTPHKTGSKVSHITFAINGEAAWNMYNQAETSMDDTQNTSKHPH